MAAFEYHEAGYATRYPTSVFVQSSGSEKTAAPYGVGSGVAAEGGGGESVVGDADTVGLGAVRAGDADWGAGTVERLGVDSPTWPTHAASKSPMTSRQVGIRMAQR